LFVLLKTIDEFENLSFCLQIILQNSPPYYISYTVAKFGTHCCYATFGNTEVFQCKVEVLLVCSKSPEIVVFC